jgi:hypothetical protein
MKSYARERATRKLEALYSRVIAVDGEPNS